MPKGLKIYIFLLCFMAVSLSSYWFLHSTIEITALPYFIALMLLAEAYKVPVVMFGSNEHVKISWSLVVSISALIGSGISEVLIVNIIGGIMCSIYPKRLPLIKFTYNVSSYVVSAAATYTIYILLQKVDPFLKSSQLFELIYIPIIYLIFNFTISTFLMKFVNKNTIQTIIKDLLGPHYHHYLLFSYIGGIQGYFYKLYGFTSLLLTSILIGVVLYSFRRTADNANRRIADLEESNRKSIDLANEMDRTLEYFIQTLTATIDARDPYTYGHSMQVSNYALAIATEMKLSHQEIETIRIAGLLHDIGKISIPETILFKDGRLTEEEYTIMKQHAAIGEEILSDIPSLSEVAKLVGMHHERYNGTGYPRNLTADQLPIGAHILGVADTLDAILSNRSYKNEKSIEEAMNEFRRCRGTYFHPVVVDSLFALREKVGDELFSNSARLVDESVIVGKVKASKGFINHIQNKLYSEEYRNVVLSRVK